MRKNTSSRRSPVPSQSVGYLGDLIAWRFGERFGSERGFCAPRDKVATLFREAGFDGSLEGKRANPPVALAEAIRGAVVGRSHEVLTLKRANKDTPLAAMVYVIDTQVGESGDTLVPGARVRIESDRAIVREPEGGQFVETCRVIAEAIAQDANSRMENVHNAELSEALGVAGRACSWAAFRKAGGVYWVPQTKAEQFRQLMDGLEKLGNFWPTVQPLFGDEDGRTMRNVSVAAEASILDELENLQRELELVEGGKVMRESTVEDRVQRCRELVVRASLYETVLNERAAELTKQIELMRGKFSGLLSMDQEDGAMHAALSAIEEVA